MPSHKRSASPYAMRLTERDEAIIQGVYDYRVLTAQQIEVLFFPTQSQMPRSLRSSCQRRLQRLYHHVYLERIHRPVILGEGRNAIAYALAREGANVIVNLLGIDREEVGWKPKHNRLGPQFLEHLLLINNVRGVVDQLTQRGSFAKMQWVDEFILKSAVYTDMMPTYMQGGRAIQIFPDGFFSLWLPDGKPPHSFFLEVDQGNMKTARWAAKVKAYQTFRSSGQSLQHFGTERFRVLAVVNSQKRLQSLKKATEKAGGTPFFWFTTSDQIDIWQPDTFRQPIWQTAGFEGIRTLF